MKTPGPEQESVGLLSLSKRFGSHTAVDVLSLSIKQGEYVTLLGPSGSGKTTTIRMIGGFDRPTAGSVVIFGRDQTSEPPHRRPVNTVFQDYALFPHLTVFENIAYGLRAQGRDATAIRQRVAAMIERLELFGLERRSPSTLSGGQRQRVALGRALVCEPRVLLLDEPLGALDLKLRKQMQFVLVDLCRASAISFIHVTHDQEEAMAISDRIAVMNSGRLEQFASPATLYHEPGSVFVAGFVGENNLFSADVVGGSLNWIGGRFALPERFRSITGPVVVAIRPEDLHIEQMPGDNVVRGSLDQVNFMGSDCRLVARLPNDSRVFVRADASVFDHFHRGDAIDLAWRPQDARIYAAPSSAESGHVDEG